MATMTGDSIASAEPISAGIPTVKSDLFMLLRWITLGIVAGGIGGLVVGGVGGRLAMLLLRLTSSNSVKGVISDDGFVIGRIDLGGTAQLLLLTAGLGAIAGVIVVAGRPFFPKRGMPIAWGVAGAIIVGAIIVDSEGVDFNLLGPKPLAVALFIAIPGVGAFLIAWLVEVFRPWWWENRRRTIIAAVAAVPALLAFVALVVPIVATVMIGAAWLIALRAEDVRTLNNARPVRIAALSVFALLVALGLNGLVRDFRDVLL